MGANETTRDESRTVLKLISASEVGRRLNMPHPRVSAAIKAGIWVPNASIGTAKCFYEGRLMELKKTEEDWRRSQLDVP